jgi:hypothetical protein
VCPDETRDTTWEELDASSKMNGFYTKAIKDPKTNKELRVTCPKHARCLEVKDDDKYWFGQCGGIKDKRDRERQRRVRYFDDYRRSVDSRDDDDDDKDYQEVFAFPMISDYQNGAGRKSIRYRRKRISSPLSSLKRSRRASFSFPLIRRFEPRD